jgi:hypothetical protein
MQVPTLSDDSLKELLQRPIVAEAASLSPGGEIRITPIWFEAQNDGSFLMNTWENTALVRNIKRNPRMSLMIDFADAQPYYGVHYSGTAKMEGPENDVDGIGRMFARYMNGNHDAATEYAKVLAGWGKRVYVRFRPEKKRSWDFRGG